MNLAWLIYFGSVSGSASAFFGFLSALGAVIALVGFILTLLWSEDSREGIRKRYEAMAVRGGNLWPRGLAMLISFGIVSTMLPSQGTVYAMAAAQIGEQVMRSEEVKGIAGDSAKALQAWIKKQIEPELKK